MDTVTLKEASELVGVKPATLKRWAETGVIPDVDESVAEVAGWITPRLGGVGPTTRAMLLRNTVEAAERRAR